MKRYPTFDPPEYLDWKPDPAVLKEYEDTILKDPQRSKRIAELNEDQLLGMYTGMLRFRLHDITLKRWVKEGILRDAWPGTGEEAVTIGSVHALDRTRDKVGPMIRNAGACHEMGISLADMLREYLGTADSPSAGKDFHVGHLASGVIAPTSEIGTLIPVFTGIALAFKQRRERSVALTWVGDGATKTTAFHEGMNLAAVLKVPAVYVLQNNQVALTMRLEQHQAGPFTAWSRAYGVASLTCAGNNVLDTYATTRIAVDLAREGHGPVMIFAETFRMGGHAIHDEAEGRKLFPPEVFQYWGKRDPIGTYESYLETRGISQAVLQEAEQQVINEVAAAEKQARTSLDKNMPKPESAIQNVYSTMAE